MTPKAPLTTLLTPQVTPLTPHGTTRNPINTPNDILMWPNDTPKYPIDTAVYVKYLHAVYVRVTGPYCSFNSEMGDPVGEKLLDSGPHVL